MPHDHDTDPVLRDQYGRPIEMGEPLTRRDIIENVVFAVFLAGIAALLIWGAA